MIVMDKEGSTFSAPNVQRVATGSIALIKLAKANASQIEKCRAPGMSPTSQTPNSMRPTNKVVTPVPKKA